MSFYGGERDEDRLTRHKSRRFSGVVLKARTGLPMFSITHMGSWKVDRLQSNFYSDHNLWASEKGSLKLRVCALLPTLGIHLQLSPKREKRERGGSVPKHEP